MLSNTKGPAILENFTFYIITSTSGHDLCPIGLTCCEITIGKFQFQHSFIVCKMSEKDLSLALKCNSHVI